MNRFQRIKGFLFGVIIILFALVVFLVPPDVGFIAIAGVIGIMLFLYGFKTLWYYLTMARHMVGGKAILIQSVVILDLAMFTESMTSMNSFAVIFYLLGIFAFTGVVSILRSFEAKRFGSSSWKLKLTGGVISVLFALLMLILGVIFKDQDILVYGFSISLIYTGITKIVTSIRKTAIIYIQ